MLDRVLVFLLLVGGVRGQGCPVGKYGDNCKLNCSRYCAPYDGQKVYCDKQTGRCSEGCIRGKYGDRCHLTCSRNCKKHICSFQTGHCVQGCEGSNTGHFCETSQEPGSKQDAASSPLVPILVPVLVIAIIIIIIITAVTVICRWRRRYDYFH
ncbi:cell death abnormality protein 1-like [Haliotis rubra]|uniref:cell death abnormality protein 1-like n=1 Tax=Haliotis rubra TaxID=36100 RepID=UPI001EE5346B|nr:cell death abnormality protein 1-like [Haliotis rubra]